MITSVCVCVCVCVYEGDEGRKELKKTIEEKNREEKRETPRRD